jgi:type VI protein secretion system component Hcp
MLLPHTFTREKPPIVKRRRIIELYVFIFTGYPVGYRKFNIKETFMKRWSILLALGIMISAANAQNVGGIWLSGPGIVSEGTGIHAGETPVLSMRDSIADVLSTSGVTIGKVVFGDFKFKKILNANSSFFFASVGKGIFLPSLSFKFYDKKPNGSFGVTLTIMLSDVMVDRYGISASNTDNKNTSAAVEEIWLFYNRIKYIDSTGNATEFTVTSHF